MSRIPISQAGPLTSHPVNFSRPTPIDNSRNEWDTSMSSTVSSNPSHTWESNSMGKDGNSATGRPISGREAGHWIEDDADTGMEADVEDNRESMGPPRRPNWDRVMQGSNNHQVTHSRTSPRPEAPRSRFHEGSMNDRTSAVPPLDFLGPEEDAAFERRIRLDYPGANVFNTGAADRSTLALSAAQGVHNATGNMAPVAFRPATSADNYLPSHEKRSFWGGLKEKLSLSRDKALGHGFGNRRPVSLEVYPGPRGSFNNPGEPPNTSQNPIGHANLFRSQEPSTAERANQPSSEEVMANYERLRSNGFFNAHAIQSTRQPGPGQGAATQPSWVPEQRPASPYLIVPGGPMLEARGKRGTKRVSPYEADHNGEHENGAPFSFKKLRKSASRILRSQAEHDNGKAPIIGNNAEGHTSNLAGDINVNASGNPFGITTRRSASGSRQREANRLAKRQHHPHNHQSQQPYMPQQQQPQPGRPLTTQGISAPIAGTFSMNVSNPFGSRMSVDTAMPSSMASSSHGSLDTTGTMYNTSSHYGATLTDVTPFYHRLPTSAAPAQAEEPVAHHPGHNNNGPGHVGETLGGGLRVRPNANRGIPSVPQIPDQFKGRLGTAGADAENLPPVQSSR